jgi:hypothetical protein
MPIISRIQVYESFRAKRAFSPLLSGTDRIPMNREVSRKGLLEAIGSPKETLQTLKMEKE